MFRLHSQSFSAFRAATFRFGLVCVGFAGIVGPGLIHAADAPNGNEEFFEKHIRPVLSEQCYKCHSSTSEKLKGGLLLDSREGLLKGGDTGAAIVPGDVENSLLVSAVRWTDKDLQMPPKHRLEPAQVADLESWVKSGAPWPKEAGANKVAKKLFDLDQRKKDHWCWQPVTPATPPEVQDGNWTHGAIDRFILAHLEEKGLKPAPDADRRTLLRRVTFDLTGLPPTPDEVEAFVADTSPDAFTKVVDRLLASPHFGERWARHWLDLVRYAESRGHEFDPDIPNAWQYRDYVIRALNEDVPYNQFVVEHIAGDLMKPRIDAKTGANESILGTGFWFLGEEVHSPVDIRQDEADRMDNRLDVMGKTFLGLTIGCARCHDHKFDAISQRDYYALTGYLISSGYRQARFETANMHRKIEADLEQLRAEAGRQVLKEVAHALRTGIDHCSEQMVWGAAALNKGDQLVASNQTSSQPASGGNGSNEATTRWAGELKRALADVRNPLHVFAVLAQETRGGTVDQAGFAQARVAAFRAFPKTPPDFTATPPGEMVVDYAAADAKGWLQDGCSFGSGPDRVGGSVFGNTSDTPLAGFETRGAAVRDPFWKSLHVHSAEHDYGELGKWDRGEKTLKTPEFTLDKGRLWYLVRGAGRAYAVVNSHLMVHGPLHAALLKEWKGEGTDWHWVDQPLTDYVGHRLHVEFSPVAEGDFAVAMVVQTNDGPPRPEGGNQLVRAACEGQGVISLETLATALQQLFGDICGRISNGSIGAGPDASARAELADWLVRRIDLFCPPDSPERIRLAESCQGFISKQSQLAARIQPDSHTAPAMFDGSGVDEFVLVRGQAKNPGAQVPRRFLEAIAGPQQPVITQGSGRLELARQIVDPANPLTARVIVNRLWYHLIGRGIVPTVDNFGVLGESPSNRELLDYLTTEFTHSENWSIKKAIREIVLSRTYQMSSRPDDAAAELADPQNLLVHRMNLRRLEGEAIRDEILSVSGRMNARIGGPSVPVHLTAFMDGRGRPGRDGPLDGDGRRSIYGEVRRNFLSPMMLAFDTPIPFNSMGRRNVSNVPAQALILMNDPFVVEQAKSWAHSLPADLGIGERITRMYLTAFSRPPTDAEIADGAAFLKDQCALYGCQDADERVWADLAHVLFNVKEFIYLN